MDALKYREARAQGIRAMQAYRQAVNTWTPPEIDWHNDDRGTFDRDGFTIAVRVDLDEYSDISWLGVFQSQWEPGAVENADGRHDSRVYRWFVPTYSEAERRADLSALGYSRGVAAYEARRQVQQDARMAVDYCEHVITVTASKGGVELGRSSVGGVGLGDDCAQARHYIAECADEQADEAIAEARETLARLCGDEAS